LAIERKERLDKIFSTTSLGMPSAVLNVLQKFFGYAVAQLVEALRYKPEGRGLDSRSSHWNFSVT
jgi:hypothetical protein